MVVSTMNIYCGTPDPNTGVPWVDILGSGLIGDTKLKLRKQNGTYLTFGLAYVSPYWIRIGGFNPHITDDIYTVEYNGRDLYTGALTCPVLELTGIYFIDVTNRPLMRDTYNQALKKIPDPTVRTALIGE